MGVGQYIASRIPTLKPPGTVPENPFKVLRLMNWRQWQFFLIALFGWTWDAFDFFTVSLTVSSLAEDFNRSKSDITWGITLVLMFRSIGSVVFGIASDKWGRKWPFIINNVLFIVLELGTGFCQTYEQFLAVRALFGIAMGGIYGNATATALEDAPPAARGVLSGMLQEGYAFGYLLATVFARALVDTTPHGWRPLFWFGACPPVLIIAIRLCLPETNSFLQRKAARHEQPGVHHVFIKQAKVGIKANWLTLIYLVLMMAGFNFMSHGSQDLYPTMLENQLEFSANRVTVTQVIANLGAMVGGIVVGHFSQMFGRRLSIIVMCVVGGALLYPYCFVRDDSIMAAAFFEQFAVQGAWGVVPIHLMELSPPELRTFVVGTAYQLGNLVSSASSTIEATIGERFPLADGAAGVKRYDYGKVMAIFMGCVFAYTILVILVGPENLGQDMSVHGNELATGNVGEAQKDVEWEGGSDTGRASVTKVERSEKEIAPIQ